MVDLRHRPRLADQAIGQRLVGPVQDLERDLAPEVLVLGAEHHPHRTRAEPIGQRVASERAPGHPRHAHALDHHRVGIRGREQRRRGDLRCRRHALLRIDQRRLAAVAGPAAGPLGPAVGPARRPLGGLAQRVDRGIAGGIARQERDQIAAVGAIVDVRDRLAFWRAYTARAGKGPAAGLLGRWIRFKAGRYRRHNVRRRAAAERAA